MGDDLMAQKSISRTAKKVKPKKKGLTKSDVVRKGKQLSNWGKWGRKESRPGS